MRGVLLVICLLLPAAAVAGIVVRALMPQMAVVEVEGERRVLRAGQTSPEGVTLIAADSEQAVIERDGQRAVYRLGETTAVTVTPRKKARIRILPRRGMYYVDGAIDGMPVAFIVDTGATLVSLNARKARELGLDPAGGVPGRVSTANGEVIVRRVRLARVRVGRIELRNVDAVILPGDSPPVALLGMSFLSRVHMVREGRVLLLEQRW